MQTQLQGACRPGGVGGETVLKFWMDILLSWPTWVREKSVLLRVDTLCMGCLQGVQSEHNNTATSSEKNGDTGQ